ncbi:MAG: hypothetical protein ACUVUC_01995 [Thermoguttaceae bacterium]
MRIVKGIEIQGKPATARFDTGPVHTYGVRGLLEGAPTQALPHPCKVALGGRSIQVKVHCLVSGAIDGLEFMSSVIPVDKVGKVAGKQIDVIMGALTMQEWQITANPTDGTLDLFGLRRREFTEFSDTYRVA